MSVLFIEYPRCSTCKRAKKWLDEHGVSYTDRHIVEETPTPRSLPLGTSARVCRCAGSSTQAA